MPISDEIDPADSGYRLPLGETPKAPAQPTGSLIGAALRQENDMVSLVNFMNERTGLTYDPAHNPMDVIKDTKYSENYLHRFVDSYSEADTRARMARIDREEDDRRIIDANGFLGIVAGVGAALLSPTTLLPAGSIATGVRTGRAVARSAGSLAAYGAASAGIQEGILYGTQETRTATESTINVATATIVSGLLGGAIGMVTAREFSALSDVVDGFRKEIRADQEAEAKGLTPATGGATSAGAASAQREALTLEGAGGAEKAAAFMSPVTRLQTSNFEASRAAVRDMSDAGLGFKENWDGVATSEGGTIETRLKMRRAPVISALESLDDAYARYFFGKQDLSGLERASAEMRGWWQSIGSPEGGKLTMQQFREEVGKAMRRDDQHAIPEVAEAARRFRETVFDPPKDEAVKIGILDKVDEDGKVLGAKSYLSRVYLRDKIIAQRDRFVGILTNHFRREQTRLADDFAAKRSKGLGELTAKLKDLEAEKAELEGAPAPITPRPTRDVYVDYEARFREAGIGKQEYTPRIDRTPDENLAQLEIADRLLKAAEKKASSPDAKAAARAKRKEFNQQRTLIERAIKEQRDMIDASSDDALKAFEGQTSEDFRVLRKPFDLQIEDAARDRDLKIERVDKMLADSLPKGTPKETRRALQNEARLTKRQIFDEYEAKVKAVEKDFDGIRKQFEKDTGAARAKIQRGITRDAKAIEKVSTKIEAAKSAIDNWDARRAKAKLTDMLDGEIEALAQDITNKILGESAMRIPGLSIVEGPNDFTKARMLSVPDREIEEFLESDVEKVARVYNASMSADIELVNKFGDVKLESVLTRLRDEFNAATSRLPEGKAGERERVRLQKAYESDRRDLEALRDRIRGKYGVPDNPDGLAYRAARVALNLNYVARLGGSTIASLPDVARPIMRYGLMSTFRDGWMPLITNLKAVKLAARELRMSGTAFEFVRDARSMELADLMDDYGRNTKFERGVQFIADRFASINLMRPWTGSMKVITGTVAMGNILRATRAVAEGKATKQQIAQLAQGGIEPDVARMIWAEASSPAGGAKVNGMHLPNTEAWTNKRALEAFRAALVREVDNVIVTPGLEKPLWMSTTLGKVVGQFKTFSLVSTQRVVLSGLQQRDAAVLQGVVVAMAMGALAAKIKAELRGDSTETWTDGQWVQEALDNSGLMGILSEVNATAEKVSAGRVGMSALTGKQVSRYASRNVVGTLLGPSADFAADLTAIGRIGDDGWTRRDTKSLRKIIPLNNVFYLRGLFDAAENGVNSQFGVPQTQQRRP